MLSAEQEHPFLIERRSLLESPDAQSRQMEQIGPDIVPGRIAGDAENLQLGQTGGPLNGHLQIAQLVDQPDALRRGATPDMTLRHRLNLRHRTVSAVSAALDKLRVTLLT